MSAALYHLTSSRDTGFAVVMTGKYSELMMVELTGNIFKPIIPADSFCVHAEFFCGIRTWWHRIS
jgi:hypothetical protein